MSEWYQKGDKASGGRKGSKGKDGTQQNRERKIPEGMVPLSKDRKKPGKDGGKQSGKDGGKQSGKDGGRQSGKDGGKQSGKDGGKPGKDPIRPAHMGKDPIRPGNMGENPIRPGNMGENPIRPANMGKDGMMGMPGKDGMRPMNPMEGMRPMNPMEGMRPMMPMPGMSPMMPMPGMSPMMPMPGMNPMMPMPGMNPMMPMEGMRPMMEGMRPMMEGMRPMGMPPDGKGPEGVNQGDETMADGVMPFPSAGLPPGKGPTPDGKGPQGPRMGSFAPQKKQSPGVIQQQMLMNAAFAAGFRPPGGGTFVAPGTDGTTETVTHPAPTEPDVNVQSVPSAPPSEPPPTLKGVTDGLLGFGESTETIPLPAAVPGVIIPPAIGDERALCPFYMKIGACRHGDQCSRQHTKPTGAQTLLLAHMYPNTLESMMVAQEEAWSDDQYDKAQGHIEQFYTEVFLELANYGEIEDMVVVDNASDHMIGNVYVKYFNDEDCERALGKLTGRFYGGKPILAETSPVMDFREARCRAFHESRCNRGGYCNFMHIKHIPKAVKRRLVRMMYEEHPEYTGGGVPEQGEKRARSSEEEESSAEEEEEQVEDPAPLTTGIINPYRRDNSEERRSLVAQWNKDLEAGTLVCV